MRAPRPCLLLDAARGGAVPVGECTVSTTNNNDNGGVSCSMNIWDMFSRSSTIYVYMCIYVYI